MSAAFDARPAKVRMDAFLFSGGGECILRACGTAEGGLL
jgi:hypothetical protein